jgi:hypothetical protein
LPEKARWQAQINKQDEEANMTTVFKSQAIHIASTKPRHTGTSAQKLASRITAGAAILALVLAALLTSTAPARADGDDLAKALFAAIVIGALIHENKKDQKKDKPKKPKPVKLPRVPAVCAIEIEGNTRSVTVYPESCLRDEGFDYRLPRGCASEARIFGRPDRIYGVQCLRDAGFSVPRG